LSSNKIFHCSEGGDVEQVARTLKQIIRVCDCFLSLSFTLTHSLLLHAIFALFHIVTYTFVLLLLVLILLLVSLLEIVFYSALFAINL